MSIRIDSKSKLKEFLRYESKKYGLRTPYYPILTIREACLLYKFNYILRKLEYYTNCKKTIRAAVVRIKYIRIQRKYSIFIPINVFDKGLKLIHIGPRLVNGNSEIGKNFTMHINTCIVAGGVNDFAPKIGNNCIMSVGSTILGDAVIGNNTVIGAGAIVTNSFSSGNMTIAGVPAKKISNNTSNDWRAERRKNRKYKDNKYAR